MTVEEIKATYTMRDILQMYGIQTNRSGFIHCPFHSGDHTASCKIYPKDFHCHACGQNGDIFTFVQQMEHCSFKEAFKRLGGSYSDKTDRERELFKYKLQKAKESRIRAYRRLRKQYREVNQKMDVARNALDEIGDEEVFSDAWCELYDKYFFAMIESDEIFEKLRGFET